MATQQEVADYVSNFIQTADLATVTIKVIKTKLADDLKAENGVHYDKDWLKQEVTRCLAARTAAVADEAAPTGGEAFAAEPDAEPEATEEQAKPKKAKKSKADKAAKVRASAATPPPLPDDAIRSARSCGRNCRASLAAGPPRERMVPARTQLMREQKQTFIYFFGTGDYAWCKGTNAWEEFKEKALKEGKRARRRNSRTSRRPSTARRRSSQSQNGTVGAQGQAEYWGGRSSRRRRSRRRRRRRRRSQRKVEEGQEGQEGRARQLDDEGASKGKQGGGQQ